MSDDLPEEFDLVVIGTGEEQLIPEKTPILIIIFFIFPGLSESVVAAGE